MMRPSVRGATRRISFSFAESIQGAAATLSAPRQRKFHNNRPVCAPCTPPKSSSVSASFATTSSTNDNDQEQDKTTINTAGNGKDSSTFGNPGSNDKVSKEKEDANSQSMNEPQERQQQQLQNNQQQHHHQHQNDNAPFLATLFRDNQRDARLLPYKAQVLLDTSIGTWTPYQFRNAVLLLHELTTPEQSSQYNRNSNNLQRRRSGDNRMSRKAKFQQNQPVHHNNNMKQVQREAGSSGTAESVMVSFKLLDRLLVEKRRSIALESKYLASSDDLINTQLLDLIVGNWSHCWKMLHQFKSDKNNSSIGDFQVVPGDAEHSAKLLMELTPDSVLSRLDAYEARSSGLLTPTRMTYHKLMEAACTSKTTAIAVKLLDRICGKDEPVEADKRYSYLRFMDMFADIGDAAQAEAVLEHMYVEYKEPSSAEKWWLRPRTLHFNKVLAAWSQVPDGGDDLKYAFERSQGILKRMQDLSTEGNAMEGASKPDTVSYGLVMKSIMRWAGSVSRQYQYEKLDDFENLGDSAEGLISEMEEVANQGNARMQSNPVHYRTALSIWEHLGNGERAEALLLRMSEDDDLKKHVDARAFNIVLGAWSKSQKKHRAIQSTVTTSYGASRADGTHFAERAEALLRHMQALASSSELTHATPNSRSYEIVRKCWVWSKSQEAAERAFNIYSEMLEKLGMDSFPRNDALEASAAAGDATNAERIIAELNQKYFEEGDTASKPTMRNLESLLLSWTKSKHTLEAPQRAEAIIEEMQKFYDDGVLNEPPSVFAYNNVLECYANTSTLKGAEQAEALLLDMEQKARNGEEQLLPNCQSYKMTINAFASVGNGEKAEAIFEKMFHDYRVRGNATAVPDTFSINFVLLALANSKSRESSQQAVAFLKRMEHLSGSENFRGKPNVISYTLLLKCLLNSTHPETGKQAEAILNDLEERVAQGDTGVTPNTMTYGTAIQLYGRLGKPAEAEALLERMYETYKGGNVNLQPNARTFTSVLQAWARSNNVDAGDRALAILQWMKDLHNSGVLDDIKPNKYTYTTVLASISKSHNEDAYEKSLMILKEMEEEAALASDNDTTPSIIAYTTVLQGIARRGDPVLTQELITKMYHQFQNGLLHEKPNISCWNFVLESWSRSNRSDAAVRAFASIEQMRKLIQAGDLEGKPTFSTFRDLLICCLKTKTHNTRKDIVPIMDELERVSVGGENVSIYSFGSILHFLCNADDDDYLERAELMLDRILGSYKMTRVKDRRNVVKSYSRLIIAWSKSRDRRSIDHIKRLKKKKAAIAARLL